MNLQNLRTFQIAARYESLTAAAEQLLYAPSTVTLHIQQLEAEWGVKLFEKNGRGVKLTQDGRSILGRVMSILNQVHSLDNMVSEMAEGEAGHLRIGVIEPIGSLFIAPLVAEFIRKRPRLQLIFESGSMYAICERVGNGDLDVGITQPAYRPTTRFEQMFTLKHQLLMPVDHPLNQLEKITIDDLRNIHPRMIFLEKVDNYEGVVFNNLVAYGSDYPFEAIEVNHLLIMIEMVRQDVGVAMFPVGHSFPVPEGLVLRRVEGHDFQMMIGLLLSARDNQQPVLFRFIEALWNMLHQNPMNEQGV